MLFFTADEHYNHHNIIEYCKRPFTSAEEMNETIITNHNALVGTDDVTVHAGDFFLKSKHNNLKATDIIPRLNGRHIFLRGNHDRWLPKKQLRELWECDFDIVVHGEQVHKHIVVHHYYLDTWPLSEYNSWLLFGHSHGQRRPRGKCWDIGVDNNTFMPLSAKRVIETLQHLPDNQDCLPPYIGY